MALPVVAADVGILLTDIDIDIIAKIVCKQTDEIEENVKKAFEDLNKVYQGKKDLSEIKIYATIYTDAVKKLSKIFQITDLVPDDILISTFFSELSSYFEFFNSGVSLIKNSGKIISGDLNSVEFAITGLKGISDSISIINAVSIVTIGKAALALPSWLSPSLTALDISIEIAKLLEIAYIQDALAIYSYELAMCYWIDGEVPEIKIPKAVFGQNQEYINKAYWGMYLSYYIPYIMKDIDIDVTNIDDTPNTPKPNNLYPDFYTMGSAFVRDDGVIELTGLKTWQGGGFWLKSSVGTTGISALEFEFFMGGGYGNSSQGNGADGITISFAPKLPQSFPQGEEMGFYGNGAFGIEFDTWYNSHRGDMRENHIAVIQNSVSTHLKTVSVGRLDDSQWHKVKIYYQDTTVTVYFDDTLVLEYTGVYKFDTAYVGMSASTGSFYNYHLLRNVKWTPVYKKIKKAFIEKRYTNIRESDIIK